MTLYQLDRPVHRLARAAPEIDTGDLGERAEAAWRRGESLATAGNLGAALNWLERAHRLAPSDQNLLFALAAIRLRNGKFQAAAALFQDIASRHGVRESWAGLAAARLAAGDPNAAAAALQAALSRNVADPGLLALADRVIAATATPGWCALMSNGAVQVKARGQSVRLRLDEASIAAGSPEGVFDLPASWQSATRLHVHAGDAELLGSPIDLAAVRRLEGFVERNQAGITGWAWHPGAPERDPELCVLDWEGREHARFTATELSGSVHGHVPLSRPRSFAFALPRAVGIRVLGPDRRDLLGSPLPATGVRNPSGSAAAAPMRVPSTRRGTIVVIPVYRGADTTLACIQSVLAHSARAPSGAPPRIIVVNDASPEPDLVAALHSLAERGRITLIPADAANPSRNRGFPGAVNAGLAAASGHDVVLLNSDTLVTAGWLGMLEDAAHSAADIGTATPLSNDATILSYPHTAQPNPLPEAAEITRIAALAAVANPGILVEIPTAHGFCMFIRHDCLAATGRMEEALFAQGYGEENDFSERARALGWRHVAVPGAYVAHIGGVSFGAGRNSLLTRNQGVLARLHPGYHPRIATFMATDALAPARRRLDAARWAAGRGEVQQAGSILLVTHGGGGGTARIVAERADSIHSRGMRAIILSAQDGRCGVDDGTKSFPNLEFSLPAELPALRALLAGDRPAGAELHHLLGHDHSVTSLFADFHLPYDVWIHDYTWLCPRVSLVTGEGRYCGEPASRVCEICVRNWGRAIDDPVSPTRLRARSAGDLARAREVIVSSEDVARRIRRHFPGVRPRVTPWQIDGPHRAPQVINRSDNRQGHLRVAVVGGIGVEKGYDVLLGCAEDAAARGLKLEFVVIGYSIDDARLEATGRVFITGPFKLGEAHALITAQSANLAFMPSIWPETWCYALSDAWQAGLSAVVFDIGAPAERVRNVGAGWVLPLGLPPPKVNDALLRIASG